MVQHGMVLWAQENTDEARDRFRWGDLNQDFQEQKTQPDLHSDAHPLLSAAGQPGLMPGLGTERSRARPVCKPVCIPKTPLLKPLSPHCYSHELTPIVLRQCRTQRDTVCISLSLSLALSHSLFVGKVH